MAFVTVPSASIASGKPVTTGLMTLYKNNDDSFNDGTGIANAAIGARALSQALIIPSDFGYPSSNTAAPTGWTPVVTQANNIAFDDAITTTDVTTLLKAAAGTFTPPVLYRSERFINSANSAIINYFYARAAAATTTSTAQWALGWGDGVTAGGGVTNMIKIFFAGTGNLVLRITKAGVAVDTTLVAYSANTLYDLRIEWTPATSIKAYVNNILYTSYTTTANFPTVVMYPVISSLLQDSLGIDNMFLSKVTIGRA